MSCRDGDECNIVCQDNQACEESILDVGAAGCTQIDCLGGDSWYDTDKFANIHSRNGY